jgi:hypothetical protein
MSDRKSVLTLPCRGNNQTVQLFMDGESGTWRLFLNPSYECADFSLAELGQLRDGLTMVLIDVLTDPDAYNAETRRERADRLDEEL